MGAGGGAFGSFGFGVDVLGFLLRGGAVGDEDDDEAADAKARGVGLMADAGNSL